MSDEDVAALVVDNSDGGLKQIFDRLDTDDDGLITSDQLTTELTRPGSPIHRIDPRSSTPTTLNFSTFEELVALN